MAAPSAAQTAADRAAVDRAVARLQSAQRRADRIEARVERTSEKLDQVIAEQSETRGRLRSRSTAMYRSGDTQFISVLLGAATFQEFASRLDLLTRMNRQDAADIRRLAALRIKAELLARSLLKSQEESARAVDAASREAASARRELAASQAALAAFRARTSSSAKDTPAKRAPDRKQRLRGSGSWRTGKASHYSRTFTGRGASGKRIGPYSMMVAHKTLPFGTLIEFEYRGKRAVASVEDRGPFTPGRMWDLGPGVVRSLGFNGVHPIRYRVIKR